MAVAYFLSVTKFDVAHSNAVIEHVGPAAAQETFT